MFYKGIKYLFLLLIYINSIDAIRKFWRGRRYDGNLGPPTEDTYLQTSPFIETEWFDQILNHSDPNGSNNLWKQRFYINEEYFKPGGPVFLMIGGEGEATVKWMSQGAWIRYAKEHSALCFQIEHRFYGKSHPTSDLSTENLRYLSSEQALADLANFIVAMNTRYDLTKENKWIAFGGSYPGSLAAWVREKYPHLVYGSISSSGPLLAEADFKEYYDVVIASLGSYSTNCVNVIKKATAQVEILLKHMIGQRTLNEKFRLCDPIENSIENDLDISSFFEGLASNFAGVVQYNKDNRASSNISIDTVCDILNNETLGPPVTRLAAVNRIILDSQNITCLDYKYNKTVSDLKNVSWDSEVAEGMRQWTYQTCTEFGFYQTSNLPNSVFGDRFPVDYFIKQCTDVYGPRYNADLLYKSIANTNRYYGGLKPGTTNVIYVHGSIDPWHALGLTTSSDPTHLPVIYINGTAHCANMYEPRDNDFPQLKQARIDINNFIRKLLLD